MPMLPLWRCDADWSWLWNLGTGTHHIFNFLPLYFSFIFLPHAIPCVTVCFWSRPLLYFALSVPHVCSFLLLAIFNWHIYQMLAHYYNLISDRIYVISAVIAVCSHCDRFCVHVRMDIHAIHIRARALTVKSLGNYSSWMKNGLNARLVEKQRQFQGKQNPSHKCTYMNESYFCSRNSIIMQTDMQATYNWHRTQYYRPGYEMKAAKSVPIQRPLCSIVEKLIWAIIEWSELSLAPARVPNDDFRWCSVFSFRTN